ncbi:hypothetical protein FXO38_09709 [Capsicum annuum]|nr:hypothetical protein FXO38_09709 [Capsicum annuum]
MVKTLDSMTAHMVYLGITYGPKHRVISRDPFLRRYIVVAANRDYEHVVCKDREDRLLEKLEVIAEAAENLKSKKGVIPSKKVKEPYTSTTAVRMKKKTISQVLSNRKSNKIATPYAPRVVEVQGLLKKCVDEILCIIRGRQLAYPDTYDAVDRIMDLNFYNNFKSRYDTLRSQTSPGGWGIDQLVSMFKWDEDIINYVRRKRRYPHGKNWT